MGAPEWVDEFPIENVDIPPIRYVSLLGGGFKYFFYFHSYLWKISNLTFIFFRWVGEKPPTSYVLRIDVSFQNLEVENGDKETWNHGYTLVI